MRTKPKRSSMVYVTAISLFAILLTYYLEYLFHKLPDGTQVSSSIGFLRYIDVRATAAHLKVMHPSYDVGAVGNLGYGLLALDVIGFALGGLAVCALLFSHPACQGCNLLLTKARSEIKNLDAFGTFTSLYEALYTDRFAQVVGYRPKPAPIARGTVSYRIAAYRCPGCGSQTLRETVLVHNGKTFSVMPKLARTRRLPDGVDCLPLFGK